MPVARFQMPDGRIGRFEVPEGTTPEQATSLINQQFFSSSPKTEETSVGRTALDQGIQGLTFGFGDEISDFLGSVGAGAYMKAFRPELMDGISANDLYNEARGMSKERLASEVNQRPGLSIVSNIAGGIATGVPKALISSLRSGGLAARAAKSGAIGSASGAVYGAGTADEGERLEGAKTGALVSGAISSALPAAGAAASATLKGAAKALTPTIEEGMRPVVALAQKYKIPVALSQVTNSNAVKNAQKVSAQLPLSGENAFRDKQMKAFNKALIGTAGGNANRFTPELMDNLFTKVGKEFDDFGKGKSFDLNDDFVKITQKLMDESEALTTEGRQKLQEGIAKIYKEADERGVITGEKLGILRNRLNRDARKASKIGNAENAEIFHDLENAVVDIIKAGDDKAGEAFAKTKQKYKNLLVLEPLAAKAKGGFISPALLNDRVSKIYGREFTRGMAGEIGDLARIGNEIMPELGGSDTYQKLLYAGGALNPFLAIKAVPYLAANRAVQSGVNRNPAVVNAAMKKSRLKSASPTKITIRPSDKVRER